MSIKKTHTYIYIINCKNKLHKVFNYVQEYNNKIFKKKNIYIPSPPFNLLFIIMSKC